MNATQSLMELYDKIRKCTACPLHTQRKHAVVGEGPVPSNLMFVGEAPGRYEDIMGRPFVGAAGRILTRILVANGVSRAQVYISNVVRCRPPGNRRPHVDEIRACIGYLLDEIKIVSPKLIVALGNTASSSLGGPEKWGEIKKSVKIGIPVMKAYHPAAAIYNPSLLSLLSGQIKKAIEYTRSL